MTTNVRVVTNRNPRKPKIVFATMLFVDGDNPAKAGPAYKPGELMISATLKYVVQAAIDRGYNIVNQHEIASTFRNVMRATKTRDLTITN